MRNGAQDDELAERVALRLQRIEGVQADVDHAVRIARELVRPGEGHVGAAGPRQLRGLGILGADHHPV